MKQVELKGFDMVLFLRPMEVKELTKDVAGCRARLKARAISAILPEYRPNHPDRSLQISEAIDLAVAQMTVLLDGTGTIRFSVNNLTVWED